MKCRGCGNDTRDYLSPDVGWMHWECEVKRLDELLTEERGEVEWLQAKLDKLSTAADGGVK